MILPPCKEALQGGFFFTNPVNPAIMMPLFPICEERAKAGSTRGCWMLPALKTAGKRVVQSNDMPLSFPEQSRARGSGARFFSRRVY